MVGGKLQKRAKQKESKNLHGEFIPHVRTSRGNAARRTRSRRVGARALSRPPAMLLATTTTATQPPAVPPLGRNWGCVVRDYVTNRTDATTHRVRVFPPPEEHLKAYATFSRLDAQRSELDRLLPSNVKMTTRVISLSLSFAHVDYPLRWTTRITPRGPSVVALLGRRSIYSARRAYSARD